MYCFFIYQWAHKLIQNVYLWWQLSDIGELMSLWLMSHTGSESKLQDNAASCGHIPVSRKSTGA